MLIKSKQKKFFKEEHEWLTTRNQLKTNISMRGKKEENINIANTMTNRVSEIEL